MSITAKDLKVLWSRAAGRCSICRIVLTHDSLHRSESYPVGEQAHIVAESENGPRGQSILLPEERDSYFNLILLCPTHHREIDTRAGCISLYGIATMHKPATNVGLHDGIERLFDRLEQRLNGPCLRTAQTRFDLRPALLNRVEVGRIRRQPEEPCASRRQQVFHPSNFMGRQIIPQHDVPGVQGRTQDLAHPTVKDRSIDSPVDDPWRIEPIQTQG